MFLILGFILQSDRSSFQLMDVSTEKDQENITLANDKQIVQTFFVDEDTHITGVRLDYNNYRKSESSISLSIYRTTSLSSAITRPNDKIIQVNKDLISFADDEQLIFSFPSKKFEKGTYLFKIESSLKEGQAFQIVKSKDDIYSPGKVFIKNGEIPANKTPISGDLAFTIYEKKGFLSLLERFEKKSLLAPTIIFIFLIFATIAAALVISEFPDRKS